MRIKFNNTQNHQKLSEARLNLWKIIPIIAIILTFEATILTHFNISDIRAFILLPALTVLIVIVIALLYDRIKERRIMIKETRAKQDEIRRYLKSLQNDINITRKNRSELFIDKLSEIITVKRWISRVFGYKEPKTILQILKNGESPVAIIGSGGTGKTFTLWKWCTDTCNKLEANLNNEKIPVYVPLAAMGKYETGDIKKHIKNIKMGGNAIDPLFDELECNGQLLFIFDGFNEIGLSIHGNREELRKYFENTTTDLCEYWRILHGNGCKVIVTSRDTTPYMEEEVRFFFRKHDFRVYVVDPLSDNNIKNISEDHLKSTSQLFIASLENIGGYGLVRDAWHFSLFVEKLLQTTPQKLPEMFQQIHELDILSTIDRNLTTTGGVSDTDEIFTFLKEIAYDIIKEEGESGKSVPRSFIKNKLASYPNIPFEHVINCGFFEKTDDKFRISQTRNEILAALKIKQSDDLKKEIEERVKDDQWHNTLLFLSKILEESDDLIDVSLKNDYFVLVAKVIKTASVVKNREIIYSFLLHLTLKLNDVRILTCKERLADPRYDKLLHTFFKVVETLGNIALTPFLDMCTTNKDPLIRAQGIYFIEETENLKLEKKHINRLSVYLNEEINFHGIFHILIVLEKFLKNDELKCDISKQVLENLNNWDDLIKLQAILILHRNALLPSSISAKYTKEHFTQQFEKHKENVIKLIDDLRNFENISKDDRKDDFNEILEKLEPSLWLVTELAKERMIDWNEALKLLSEALNENSSPFWIVRWWAIFNLGKIETDKAKKLLLNNIMDPVLDIGLLCIKSLAASEKGEASIRSFCEDANEKLPTLSEEQKKDLTIRINEAKDALEMLNRIQKY